ncbi:hypothetical protein TrRE_jg3061 [Triparma retinervis]|uniref:SET domain-containing protein n=1 Tax=Triparma retinervis TaxID=2557542 RepID=A0A9W7AG17_9STRA|nr:hypothetical protein TrRE_jg3061 [Triparma retinervis]
MVVSGLHASGLCAGGLVCGFTVPEVKDLFCRINQNSFTVADPEIQPLGVGMYLLASAINHSCAPSGVSSFSLFRFSLPSIIVRTISPLLPSAEVTTSYMDVVGPRESRVSYLGEAYNFECSCPACGVPEAPSRTSLYVKLSEARSRSVEMIDEGRFEEALNTLRQTPEMWEELTPEYFPVKGLELFKVAKLEASFGDMGRAAELRRKGEEVFEVCYGRGSVNFEKIMKAAVG